MSPRSTFVSVKLFTCHIPQFIRISIRKSPLRIYTANVCFNFTSNGLVACDGNLEPCDECGVYGCDTGLPLQPAGYGPPDDVKISISAPFDYTQCEESNPQGIRRWEVGDGIVFCAGVAYRITFIGDSNPSYSPNMGHIDYEPNYQWACTNGSQISGWGSVDFEIDCTYDSGNNATCVIPAGDNVVIPLLGYTIS